MSREKFEELPEIKVHLDHGNVFFNEEKNCYCSEFSSLHFVACFVSGAWLIWQKQQKRIDELHVENQKLALANTKYFNGNKDYFFKLNALNKVLNHAIDGFYGHEHEGVCLNNLIDDLKFAFNKESEP